MRWKKRHPDGVEDLFDLRGHLPAKELRREERLFRQCNDHGIPLSARQRL